MSAVRFFFVWIAFSVRYGAFCNGDIEIVYDKLEILSNGVRLLSDRFDAIENQMSIDKAIIIQKQEERILSLKNEFKTDIRQHVQTALSEILRGESFEDIIKSEVVSEMRHLRHANHQIRRQLHQLMTSVGQVKNYNRMYREALQKGERENSELMSCSKYLFKSELLIFELAERDRQIDELKSKLSEQSDPCTPSNIETDSGIECSKCYHTQTVTNRLIEHGHRIGELNQTLMTYLFKESTRTIHENDTVLETTTPIPFTTPSTAVVEPTTIINGQTTIDTQEERSRILVAPLWRSSSHQFRQVNIHSNYLDIYSYLHLRSVISLVFISKLNSIFIGLYSPYKIISSKLYSSRVVTVRHNVRTFGMAADEKREMIFLTTRHPSMTISRMSLQGKRFRAVINLSRYGRNPFSISVYPDTKMIFACDDVKLFTVGYDGRGLTTLDSGSHMYAVTLDINNGLLYYSKGEKLMKMSLSSNTRFEVTKFGFTVLNLIYYREAVYYISYSSPYGTLGAVDVGHSIVSYTLQTVKVTGVKYFGICLIP